MTVTYDNLDSVIEIPMPLLPPRATSDRLAAFSDIIYKITDDTHIYKWVDAICGDSGAGEVKKQLTLARLSQSLDTMYYGDLDSVYTGNFNFNRLAEETYPYNPYADQLTSAQWDEIEIKDASYRDRIKKFFKACQAGGTPEGIRLAVQSALAVDCDIFEVWKYIDNFNITTPMGRSQHASRNEIVVKPHLQPGTTLNNRDRYRAMKLVQRLAPVDTIVTIDLNGLETDLPVAINSVGASSSYFEVQQTITGVSSLANLSRTYSQQFLTINTPVPAPSLALNKTQETTIYYTYSTGIANAIDKILYYTVPDSIGAEVSEETYSYSAVPALSYGPWTAYAKADSPDNFPGGKNGKHPQYGPAVKRDGNPYVFEWADQLEYVSYMLIHVKLKGGQATLVQYRLPTKVSATSLISYPPEQAVPITVPTKVLTGWNNP